MFNRDYGYFELHEAEYRRFISWEGEVGRFMNRRIRDYMGHVRASIPTKSGRLRNSLKVNRKRPSVIGLEVEIGATAPYAYMVHEGTGVYNNGKPYLIEPKKKGDLLRFKSVMLGVVYRSTVVHPGIPGQFFLTRWLKELVA